MDACRADGAPRRRRAGVRDRAQRGEGGVPPARARATLRPAPAGAGREQLRHAADAPVGDRKPGAARRGDAGRRARLPRGVLRPRYRDADRFGQFRPRYAQPAGRPLFRRHPGPRQRHSIGDHRARGAAHQAAAGDELRAQRAAADDRVELAHPGLAPPRHGGARGARRGAVARREFAPLPRAGPRSADRGERGRAAAGRGGRRLLRAQRHAGGRSYRRRGGAGARRRDRARARPAGDGGRARRGEERAPVRRAQ